MLPRSNLEGLIQARCWDKKGGALALELAVADGPAALVPNEVASRSLRQIVWARLRRDKLAMVCLIILIILYLIAIFAPLICDLLGVDPYSFDKESISDSGGGPVGPWGGISTEHPLGVEWGRGAIFSRS